MNKTCLYAVLFIYTKESQHNTKTQGQSDLMSYNYKGVVRNKADASQFPHSGKFSIRHPCETYELDSEDGYSPTL